MNIKKYAVIGHPIGHTMSPFIHKRLFALSGINAEYGVMDIAPENLKAEYESTLKQLDGFNITIPHKQNIIPLIDRIDKKAEMYGSVNTVSIRDGIAKGYTTDPDGFLKALEAAKITIGGRVVILGCGGVARTMAYEVVLKGAALTFAVRDEDVEIAKALCSEITNTVKGANVQYCLISQLEGDIDVLINATPLGMYPKTEIQPVSDKVIFRSKSVFDAVYNPLETVLIQKALSNGSRAVGGMAMLVWQAVVAHEKWDNSTYDVKDIEKICIDASKELENK
ncbi:MAG: shikimate dehydrogenase [Oscillospiraceae bacterium]|nr:shikimate dehydrogenase [Oscillospiraceae bacterium]